MVTASELETMAASCSELCGADSICELLLGQVCGLLCASTWGGLFPCQPDTLLWLPWPNVAASPAPIMQAEARRALAGVKVEVVRHTGVFASGWTEVSCRQTCSTSWFVVPAISDTSCCAYICEVWNLLRQNPPPSTPGGPAVRDIHLENFSVSNGGAELIENGTCTLAWGRRRDLRSIGALTVCSHLWTSCEL